MVDLLEFRLVVGGKSYQADKIYQNDKEIGYLFTLDGKDIAQLRMIPRRRKATKAWDLWIWLQNESPQGKCRGSIFVDQFTIKASAEGYRFVWPDPRWDVGTRLGPAEIVTATNLTLEEGAGQLVRVLYVPQSATDEAAREEAKFTKLRAGPLILETDDVLPPHAATTSNLVKHAGRQVCRFQDPYTGQQGGERVKAPYCTWPEPGSQALDNLLLLAACELERPLPWNAVQRNGDFAIRWRYQRRFLQNYEDIYPFGPPHITGREYLVGRKGPDGLYLAPETTALAQAPSRAKTFPSYTGTDFEHVMTPELMAYAFTGIDWFAEAVIQKAEAMLSTNTARGMPAWSERVLGHLVRLFINAWRLTEEEHFYDAAALIVRTTIQSAGRLFPDRRYGYRCIFAWEHGASNNTKCKPWMGANALQALVQFLRWEIERVFVDGLEPTIDAVKLWQVIVETLWFYQGRCYRAGQGFVYEYWPYADGGDGNYAWGSTRWHHLQMGSILYWFEKWVPPYLIEWLKVVLARCLEEEAREQSDPNSNIYSAAAKRYMAGERGSANAIIIAAS